jgi:amino acid transporter
METKTTHRKVLGGLDLMLFSVSAVLVLDTVAGSAALGMQTFFWYILTLIALFIPYGMISAELGAAIPDEGGLYVWVTRAFGKTTGMLVSWLYWINVAYWMPSVYMIFAGTLAALFFPKLGTWGQVAIAVVMTWATVYIGIQALNKSKQVPNIGAVTKVIVLIALGAVGIAAIADKGFANPVASFRDFMPDWSNAIGYLPYVVYNFMGFELMSSMGASMHNPKKDVPKAILGAGALIFVFYVIGTWGILATLPIKDITFTGIIDAIQMSLQQFGGAGHTFSIIFGVLILYSLFSNMVTWTLGANEMIAVAAQEGDMPAVLGKMHPTKNTPVAAYVITGIIGTVLLVGNGFFADSSSSIFAIIFALSSLVFLLPYLFMFPAFLKLRYSEPGLERPFMVPGGKVGAWIMAIICEVFIAVASFLFFYQPATEVSSLAMYRLQVGGVTAVTVVLGYALYRWAKSHAARA